MKLKHILGVSAGFHDAAITVINSAGDIKFAGHSERYSKKKNDSHISPELLADISAYPIDTIAYYERPWVKQLRSLYAGQGVDWKAITLEQVIGRELGSYYKKCRNDLVACAWSNVTALQLRGFNHHLSHAAAGFQTSPYDRATVVVIDAIGEFDTISIWGAEYDSKGKATYQRLWGQRYPHSIGLFYSAVTKRVGLHPLDEEYITMGMSAWGQPNWYQRMHRDLIANDNTIEFRDNLHLGISDTYLDMATNEDLAASAQALAETLIDSVMARARGFGWSNNLVYMGGVALNCLANRNLGNYFDHIWIMPCPGDAGSSLGAAALAHGGRLNWHNAYLGHDIAGPYPTNALLDELIVNKIVGVASGRAEFGPRALGNRSLLADPRGPEIKDRVNEIKRRQQFRPFAPVILAEHVHEYFDVPAGWSDTSYMQVVARCRRPELFPAIVHVDGTSRIQTVAPDSDSGIRELLEKWYVMTGCPMLLNTSLNIRGEPMVNDRADADRFEQQYSVKVCS
jgi:carbamoyltransferase